MAEKMPIPLEGRNNTTQQVSFIRRDISHKETDLEAKIGVLPRGAVITSMKAYVRLGFPAAKLKLGKAWGSAEYGEKDIKDKGIQDYTPTDSKLFVPLTEELHIYGKRDKATTAGDLTVIIKFIQNK